MADTSDKEPAALITTSEVEDAGTDPWARLKAARDKYAYAAAWLELQCARFPGALQAVVVLGAPDSGPFGPIATWPQDAVGNRDLVSAIESVVSTRKASVRTAPSGPSAKPAHDVIACPILADNRICGAVAIELSQAAESEQREALAQLEWGAAWLELLIRRAKLTSTDRLVTVLELLATSLHHERFQEAATAVVTELANVFKCERVSIGFMKGKHTEIGALSHSAQFGKKANIVRAIEAAMDEAIDQHATVVHPPREGEPIRVTRAHNELHKKHGENYLCTVPFAEGERVLGAIIMERPGDTPFDPATVQLCEHAAALLGPILDVKRNNDRWLVQKIWDSTKATAKKLIGPRHTALKITVYSLAFLLVFFSFADGDYRVTADATLEGTVQRVIAAPMAGYVAMAHVRAGDIVREGQEMVSLDEKDLRLERLKWVSQRAQRAREHSEALAEHDRAKVGILSAQIDQAEAQIALIDEQLARMRVVAPFDGIVVSGDLSQALGAPVERGDVLFEVAPLNAYRVILEVDERDIGNVALQQPGELVLSGLPDAPLGIAVDKITPVSNAEEGRNYFRVEAKLAGAASDVLRPGMQGVGKIHAGERKLIWIWTYKITHWMRMFFWSWWP